MSLFRLILQTDDSVHGAHASFASAAEAARAAAASALSEAVHGKLEYNVRGLSPDPLHGNRGEFSVAAAVVASGTMVAGGVTEAEIVTGGETLILTISGAQWAEDVGEDSAATTALLAGLDSAGSDGGGWNTTVIGAALTHAHVVRTSDTVVTITLPAVDAYWILDNETITANIPAAAVNEGVAITATPTIPITDGAESAALTGTAVAGGVTEAEIVSGGETVIITLTNSRWLDEVGDDNAVTTALIAGFDGDDGGGNGFNTEVRANMDFGDVVRDSDTQVTVTFPAAAGYSITTDEDITVTVPAAAVREGQALVATPVVTVTAA